MTTRPNDHWHTLAKKGKDKWNEWAKAELNKEIVKRQRVDFRNIDFDNIDFQDFIFPSNTFFVKCQFNERVMFRGSVFYDTLSVSETIFHKVAVFDQCKFHGNAFFWEKVTFCDTVYFNQSFFRRNINFSNAEIQKSVNLGQTVILGGLAFQTSKIEGMADFREALILLDEAENEEKGNLKSEAEIIDKALTRAKANLNSEVDNRSIDIQNTDFNSQVSFFKAKIIGNWNLELARFEKIVNFSGVEFHKPLNLSQAEFKVPPIFSGAKFNYQVGDKKWDDFWEKAKSSDSYLHYMRLKKIAADAQDHETELQLFVLETKAKRFHFHSWPTESIALIYNVLYDMTSEFGKSGFRPPLWLFLTLFVTECSTAVVANPPRSVLDLDGDVFAFTASNIFSFTSMASDMRNNSIKSLCNVADVKDCPNIHTYYTIAGFSSFFSLILFFLLGLGIRNRFRIK